MKVYLRLLGYARPYVRLISVALLLTLLIIALQGISVWVGAEFIERLISGRNPTAGDGQLFGIVPLLDGLARHVLIRSSTFSSIIAATSVLVWARLLMSIFQVAKMYCLAKVSQPILAHLRNSLFDHLTRFDISFSKTVRPGEVASIFTKDIDQLNLALFDAVDRAVLHPFRLALIIGLMASQSITLTLWLIVFFSIGSIVVHFAGNRIEKMCHLALERISMLQGHLTEYLSSAILSRLLNKESFERHQFNITSNSISDQLVRIVFMRNLAPEMVRGLFAIAAGGILVIGGYQVFVLASLTANALIKIILLMPLAVFSIEELASMYVSIRASIASSRRVFHLLDTTAPLPSHANGMAFDEFKEKIVFADVGYVEGDRFILSDISFTIPMHAKVIIHGPSGAGKSTLLALLAGVLQPSKGNILIDGVDLQKIQPAAWRHLVGVVLQDSILLNCSVGDNLRYAKPAASDAELERVLAVANIQSGAPPLSRGLATPVGNRGELLSGGERQRLAIARALLTDPQILLMDEPTSMLDRDSRLAVRNSILSAAKGRTLILVTHDDELRRIADSSFCLTNGRLKLSENNIDNYQFC